MRDDSAPVPATDDTTAGPPKRAGRGGRRPSGTGSLRRVKGREGTWRAGLVVQGRVYSANGPGPEAAWKRLQDKLAREGLRPPGAPDPARVTVAAYARAWLARREVEVGRGLERASWRRHEQALSLHLLPAIGHLPLAGLTAAHLEEHYARLLGPPTGLAVETVRAGPCPLSPREREILAACAEGLSSAEIATRLWLSEGTVRNKVSEVLGKLGARNRAEAVQIARENGWL
jgi:DNA-binding CsgD family transcriptional regulator